MANMLRLAWPSYTNEAIFMFHATTLVFFTGFQRGNKKEMRFIMPVISLIKPLILLFLINCWLLLYFVNIIDNWFIWLNK